jgi:hypothetical protein
LVLKSESRIEHPSFSTKVSHLAIEKSRIELLNCLLLAVQEFRNFASKVLV